MIRLITENFGWKLLSLVLACVLWFVFVGDQELTTSITVPVQYRNVPKQLVISSALVDTVHLQLRGPSTRLSRLLGQNLGVILDLGNDLRPGERTFTIRDTHLDLPPGVVLDRAIPSQIRLNLEFQASKPVPVDVRFSGPPAPGYRLVETVVRPEQLWIVGPQSRVRGIEAVETDAIDLHQVLGTQEFKVHAFVEDPMVSFQDNSEVTVTVRVEIESPENQGRKR